MAMLTVRAATPEDVPALRRLIERSVRALQTGDYTAAQIEGALGTVYGTDKQMIEDGTFLVAVADADGQMAGCGGWSRRRTAFGSDTSPVKDDAALDPTADPAKIRGFFTDPEFARQGVASRILAQCEHAAAHAGFRSLELVSTLTGVAFYLRHGYNAVEPVTLILPNGQSYDAVRMAKELRSVSESRAAR